MTKICKHLKEKNPEREAEFKTGAKEMVGFILKNFADFTFYTPQSFDTENSIIMSYWEDEALSPTFLYFADGLVGKLV